MDEPKEMNAQEKAAAEYKAKLDARVSELKNNEGKKFVPKTKNPRFPNQIITVLAYAGVAKIATGESAHIFAAESKNPDFYFTPPATKFLAEHEPYTEPEPKIEQAQEQPIQLKEIV